MTHERLAKAPLDTATHAASHNDAPMKAALPIDLDKAFESIGQGSIMDGLGSTAEAGPAPSTPVSRADRAALDAVRPAMLLWIQRITQASRAVEDAGKNPDRAAASRRVNQRDRRGVAAMKCFIVLLLLGFSSVARADPNHDALKGPLILVEADRQLFDVFATIDQSAPPNSLSTKFRLARDAYLRACKSGVARGCWTSMWMNAGIEQDYAFEMKQLLAMCRRGAIMACRALQRPPTGKLLQSRDLGFAGTTRACVLGEPRCDQRRLRAECARGFALSCRRSNDDQLKERGKQLAREGCALGLYIECTEDDPVDAVRRCTLFLRACLVIFPKVMPEKARIELAERACKIGGRPTCVLLATFYALNGVPQPVPGRARYLAKRFCTTAQFADPKDVCFELGGLRPKLARLP